MKSSLRTSILRAIPAAAIVASIATPVFAQTARDLNSLGIGLFQGSLGNGLVQLIQLALLVGGIIAFLFVLYGGFVYLTAGGDAARATTGRTIIINALIGIIIIFLSLALVRFVIQRTQNQNIGGSVISANF